MSELTYANFPKLKLHGGEIELKHPLIKYKSTGQKILYVSDALTKEELLTKKIFAGDMGSTISRAFDHAIKLGNLEPRSILITTTHVAKRSTTLNDKQRFSNQRKIFKRLVTVIKKFRPDTVIIAGHYELELWRKFTGVKFVGDYNILNKPEFRDDWIKFRGRLVSAKISGFKCNVQITFSPKQVASSNPKHYSNYVQLLGFVVRDFETAIRGNNLYTLDKKKPELKIIRNIEQFDKFYSILLKAKTPCIDTETDNLLRVHGNKLLCILFSFDGKTCWMVPYHHSQTPFTPKELAYIKAKLVDYFEKADTVVSIFHNSKFDIMQFFSQLGIRYYNHKIWDTMVGKYALEENTKFVNMALNTKGAYGLDTFACEYGGFGYFNTEIRKVDRSKMASYSLEQICEYGAYDVCFPYQIARFQMQEYKRRGVEHKNSFKFVTELCSDILYVFVEMEKQGLLVDIKYLTSLMAPNSELNEKIRESKVKFKDNKAVQEANNYVLSNTGVPATGKGIFGQGHNSWVFDINKPKHQQALFFEVLGLEPLEYRKDGGGKINKDFIEEYAATVPQVEMLQKHRSLEVLKNTYVTGIFEQLMESNDGSIDYRLRASYILIAIVTSRTAASKPNLQAIPSHGPLAKIIKRMFIASLGNIMVKCDFCLAGSTLIPTENGLLRLDQIGNKNGPKRQNIDLLMAGKNNPAKAVKWIYSGEQQVFHVKTKYGNTISGTEDHRLLVHSFIDSKNEWKPIKDCSVGDYLCLNLKEMVRIKPLSLNLSDQTFLNKNNTTGATNVYQETRWLTNKWYSRVKVNGVYTYFRGFDTFEEALNAKIAFLKSTEIHENQSFLVLNKPEYMTPDLAFVIGFIVAEGCLSRTRVGYNSINVSNNDKKLLKIYRKRLRNVFGNAVKCKIQLKVKKGSRITINGVKTRSNHNHYQLRIISNQLVKWLKELGVYNQLDKKRKKTASHYKRVPWSILQADKECQLAFMAAYLEGDDRVDNKSHTLTWYSASSELIKGMRAILNSHSLFTYQCNNKTARGIRLSRRNSQNYWKLLKPYMVTKSLDNHVCTVDRHTDKQYVPIVSIKKGKIIPVYDLTIESSKPPAFVANGLIVHNSAHEIRGWCNISKDDKIANSFAEGMHLRRRLRILRGHDLELDADLLEWLVDNNWFDKKTSFEDKQKAAKKLSNRKRLKEAVDILLELEVKGDPHKVNYCVTGDTLVASNKGLIRIENMDKGDYIVAGRFKPEKVAKWHYTGIKPVIEVTTEYGNSLKTTYNHNYLVLDETIGKTVWRKAEDLCVGDRLVINPKQIVRKSPLSIDIHNKFVNNPRSIIPKTPKHMTPKLAYIISLLIAEGCLAVTKNGYYIHFCNTDKNLMEAYVNYTKDVFGVDVKYRYIFNGLGRKKIYTASTGNKQLLEAYEQLGLLVSRDGQYSNRRGAFNKEIPNCILQADEKSQLAFLAAYLEGDGSTVNKGYLAWFSSSLKLLQQMQIILNSHGVSNSSIKPMKTCIYLRVNKTKAHVIWNKIKPYMVSKTWGSIDLGDRSGLPMQYWKALVKSRQLSRNVFQNDINKPVKITRWRKWLTVYYPYNCRWADAESHVNNLKIIIHSAWEKLIKLKKAQYSYPKITKIVKLGKEKVYDLTIVDGKEPSFVANGLVIHNSFFYNINAADVTPEQRQGVKQTVFGVIYEKAKGSLARDLFKKEIKPILRKFIPKLRELDEDSDEYDQLRQQQNKELKPYTDKAQALIDMLYKKFDKGGKWIRGTQKYAQENLHATTVFGMVRHAWGHLHHDQGARAMMNRKLPNSLIQGPSSNLGYTGAKIMLDICWQLMQKQIYLGYRHENSVHDCVAGDTLIHTTKGLIRIDKLAKGFSQNIDITVSGRYKQVKISRWINKGIRPTRTVITELGNHITATPNHHLLVIDLKGNTSYKKIIDIKIGDNLCVPLRNLPSKHTLKLNLSDYVPKIRLNGRNKTPGIESPAIVANIVNNITKPKIMTPELAFCLALIISEGTIRQRSIQIPNSDKKLLDTTSNYIYKVFNIVGNVRPVGKPGVSIKNQYVAEFNSVLLVQWMKELGLYCGGYKDKKSPSYYKIVPWAILQADKESQLAFIAGYIEGDGRLSNETWIQSMSETLLDQFQSMLLSHGYYARKRAKKVVLDNINSVRLAADCNKYWVTRDYESKHLATLSRYRETKKYMITPVISNEKNIDQPVYDLTVAKGEPAYVANGIISHNSLETESKIAMLPLTLYYMEHSLTTQTHKRSRETYGFEMIIGLEIDMEIGGSLSRTQKWDFSTASLLRIAEEEIDWMKKELGYDLNKKHLLKCIKHNQALVLPYRIKELEAQKDSYDPPEKMTLTPKVAATLKWVT